MSRNFALERKLARALKGEVKVDAFTRGRYATDASIYQIMPAAVAFPKDADDLEAVLTIAREEGVPVIPRGAGTSQNGQPIGAGIVVDFSRHLNEARAYDREARTDHGGVLPADAFEPRASCTSLGIRPAWSTRSKRPTPAASRKCTSWSSASPMKFAIRSTPSA